MDNSKCVILVPAAHYIEPHCDLSLRQLESQGYPVRRVYGFANIDRARSLIATEALAAGFEELMWIDADIAFEPASIPRLRSHNLPIVCGLYPTKIEKRLTSGLLPGTATVTFGRDGGLLEIAYAATGFLYTRRQVYLDIQQRENLPVCNRHTRQPIVPFFLPLVVQFGPDDYRYLTEDFSFCERARRCGHHIYADTTIRLQHIGIYGYSWEDAGDALPRHSSYVLRLSPEEQRREG
jgi:hypothetical protein